MNSLKRLKEKIDKSLSCKDEEIQDLEGKEADMLSLIEKTKHAQFVSHKKMVLRDFQNWKESLERDFTALELVSEGFNTDQSSVTLGVKSTLCNTPIIIAIECNITHSPAMYYGIKRLPNDFSLQVPDALQQVLAKNKLEDQPPNWYGSKRTSVDYGYVDLKKLIVTVLYC